MLLLILLEDKSLLLSFCCYFYLIEFILLKLLKLELFWVILFSLLSSLSLLSRLSKLALSFLTILLSSLPLTIFLPVIGVWSLLFESYFSRYKSNFYFSRSYPLFNILSFYWILSLIFCYFFNSMAEVWLLLFALLLFDIFWFNNCIYLTFFWFYCGYYFLAISDYNNKVHVCCLLVIDELFSFDQVYLN